MKQITIDGINRKIEGSIELSGAKNSALKVLAASVLATTPITLSNMPLGMADILTKIQMLESIGAEITLKSESELTIWWPPGTPRPEIPDAFGSVRTTLQLLSGLASRLGRARVPIPGGCEIGERRFDLHIMALHKLGFECSCEDRFLEAVKKEHQGSRIEFPLRTTGGTESAIVGSVLAPGLTRILNAHTRPEVTDLVACLNGMGAKARVLGSGCIEVEGVEALHGTSHAIIPDNVEAITYVALAVVTKGKLLIRSFPWRHLEVPVIYLRESGIRFVAEGDGALVDATGPLTPLDLSTGSYPGINSDFQPLFSLMASQAQGTSYITDIRFRSRFQYVSELQKMGVAAEVKDSTVIVNGPVSLRGAEVWATDLRGGAALLVSAIGAQGRTTISNAEQIERGYEKLEQKLASINVPISTQQLGKP